jgi:hypothetical protein
VATVPKRQQILEALAERLGAISVENGYLTNAGERVYLGETPELGNDDPVNAIAIVVQDTDTRYQGMQVLESIPIEIQALARAENLDAAYLSSESILGDIIRAVEQEDRTLGGLVKQQIQLGSTRTLPREPGMTTVGIGITYRTDFTRAWGQP